MTSNKDVLQGTTSGLLLTDSALNEIKEMYLEAIPSIEYALLFFYPFVYWVLGALTLVNFISTEVCMVGVFIFGVFEILIPLKYFGATAKTKLDVINSMKIQKTSKYWNYISSRFPVSKNPSRETDLWYVKNYIRSNSLLGTQRLPKQIGFGGIVFCSICIVFS